MDTPKTWILSVANVRIVKASVTRMMFLMYVVGADILVTVLTVLSDYDTLSGQHSHANQDDCSGTREGTA